jgi:hypothetical protein
VAYTAEIQIGVRGTRQLEQLRSEINKSSVAAQSLSDVVSARGSLVQNIKNYQGLLNKAANSLSTVTAGTLAEIKAIKEYVTILGQSNAARQRQEILIDTEIKQRQSIASINRVANAGVLGTKSQVSTRVQEFLDNKRSAQIARETNATAMAREQMLAGGQYGLDVLPAGKTLSPGGNTISAQKQYRDVLNQTAIIQNAVAVAAERTGRSQRQLEIAAIATAKSTAQKVEISKVQNKLDEQSVAIARARNQELAKELGIEVKIGNAAETTNKKRKGTAGGTSKKREGAGGEGGISGFSDAVIGGAFPLLFGQGIGASAGGALGGFAGSNIAGGKGGFGGSLVGTIVGQATIDFAINSAVKLGQALIDPTEKIDDLIGFLGIAGTQLNDNIKVLRSLGLSSTASAVALAKLETTLQKEGFKNAQEFGKDLQTLSNAFGRLQLSAANLAAGALPGILDVLTEVLKGAGQAPLAPVLTPKTKSPAEAIKQAQAFNLIGPQPDSTLTAERVAQKAVSDEKQRQLRLATAQKNLEADTLSLTRVDLATQQGAVAIQQVQNDLARKQLEYKNETTAAAKELLGLEVQVLEQQQAQAQAAQRNAVIEAQRAVTRQIGSLLIEQTELENQILVLRNESAKLLHGEEVSLTRQLNTLEQRYQNEIDILFVRRDLEKLGVNEAEVVQEINTKYNGLASVVKQRSKNETETLKQQQAQYNLTQLQIQQQRQLANMETGGRFQLELQRTRSFADPVNTGFFGNALLNQKLALEEYSVTLSNYDAQLLALQERIAVPGLNSDTVLGLTQQSEALKDQIALYKEYQPAIIQARLEQERYNTILNATNPIVDNLFSSITNLVAGTMTAKEAFASFLNSIADMLADAAKKMIAQYIAIGVARIFAGFSPGMANAASPEAYAVGTGGSINVAAKGATFSNGIAKFARGGIVDSPTLFKFANGGAMQTGLMGEAGPEAIMPLTRGPGGQLGVSNFGGGGTTNVVVNVDASGNSNVQSDQQQARQLGVAVSAAVQAELVKQQRPGGLLAGTRR